MAFAFSIRGPVTAHTATTVPRIPKRGEPFAPPRIHETGIHQVMGSAIIVASSSVSWNHPGIERRGSLGSSCGPAPWPIRIP